MYEPTSIPSDAPPGIRSWLSQQFRRVADSLRAPEVNGLRFSILTAPPATFQNGDLVFADGTNWNPGGGAGLYQRVGGAWSKL